MPSSFFLNDPPTPEFSPLPLHDALPIWGPITTAWLSATCRRRRRTASGPMPSLDRKSTRLNSSHSSISYALFFFFKRPADPRVLPSSPTRRSSDLGTYHHSLVVSNLSEAAADSIGANALL